MSQKHPHRDRERAAQNRRKKAQELKQAKKAARTTPAKNEAKK